LAPKLWKSIQLECAGKIDSLIELLQGKLSSAVMQIVTRPQTGLFPSPKEIDLNCSCPDWADLCKHVAATLYGVGARLDQNPGLLFLLRGVDPSDLISKASAAEAVRQTTASPNGAPVMTESEVADVFGIDLEPPSASGAAPDAPSTEIPSLDASPPPAPAAPSVPKRAPRRKLGARQKPRPRQAIGASARARIAAAAKARWQRAKEQGANGKGKRPPKDGGSRDGQY
jgi:SWIM zinc finger